MRAARSLEQVAVLTSTQPGDDQIQALCRELSVDCIRGDEEDVLGRFLEGLARLRPEAVVRATADNPLIDPEIVDELVALFSSDRQIAYAAVAAGPGLPPEVKRFPHGLDAEVVIASALETAGREAAEPYDREHVTPYVIRDPLRFPAALLESAIDYGEHRWTLDYPDDLPFLRAVFEQMGCEREVFGWRDVLELVSRNPRLARLHRREF